MNNPFQRFNRYYSNEELEDSLQRLAAEYPELLQLSSIGKSYEGRPLWLATVTNHATGVAESKPALWADANIHATEIAGTTVAVALLTTLLERYVACDVQAKRILDTTTIYVAPRLCPDGADRMLRAKPELFRSGVRQYPDRELAEGIHLEDIDGDGRVLQMRIPDPQGEWKRSSLHPELMERRAPHEHGGEYYRLFPEGMLHDYDGLTLKTAHSPSRLDFNRNFPTAWRPEADQTGAGPHPVSEPEVRAVVEFVANHPNINLALAYHTYGAVLLRPYDDRPDDVMATQDLWTYDLLGNIGAEICGYQHGSSKELLKYDPKDVITGTEDTWFFDERGIFAWIVELWSLPKKAGVDSQKQVEWFRAHLHSDDLKIYDWYRREVPDGDAYVTWYPFDHPQLGSVELGGWNKLYAFRNPPHRFMGEEAEKNVTFALTLLDTLPHLSLFRCETMQLGTGLFQIRFAVENTGFLPTSTSEQAKRRCAARPVTATLHLPDGAALVSGKRKTERGHLAGRSCTHFDAHWGLVSSGTGSRASVEWTIRGKSGDTVQIVVTSDRAGNLFHTVSLP